MGDPEPRAIFGLLVAIAVRINSVANVLRKSSESTEGSSTELRARQGIRQSYTDMRTTQSGDRGSSTLGGKGLPEN